MDIPDIDITYEPHYSNNDEACQDAIAEADESSDRFWSDTSDWFGGDSNTTFGDVFESGMDAWGDASRVDDACDTGGLF